MPVLGTSSGSTKGAPATPTSVTATSPTSTTASVAFTAPNFSKLPITSYTVTSSPGSLTGTGASSPITVSGLTAGTSYTFTATATNASGTSAASAVSNSVAPVRTYAVGDVGPGGGWITYDAGAQESWGRYLEISPPSALGSSAGVWSNTGTTADIKNNDGYGEIGLGQRNTTTILSKGWSVPPATACNNLVYGGKSDWFLPSVQEMFTLAQNATIKARYGTANYSINADNRIQFWTSTEESGNPATVWFYGAYGTPEYGTAYKNNPMICTVAFRYVQAGE